MTELEIDLFMKNVTGKKIRRANIWKKLQQDAYFIPQKLINICGQICMQGLLHNEYCPGIENLPLGNGFDPARLPNSTCNYWHWEFCVEESKPTSCECGAHKTRNPMCHSHWCPCFTKHSYSL